MLNLKKSVLALFNLTSANAFLKRAIVAAIRMASEVCFLIFPLSSFFDSSNALRFKGGAYAHFKSPHVPTLAKELTREAFDVIIGCDGRRNTFSRYFPRNNRRGKLAIGLTANFTNRRTEEEAHCAEISGVSRIYNQKLFKDLQDETGIELENLVYYRDETHYFVMTATKASLLRRGVLRSDYGDSHALLSNTNSKRAPIFQSVFFDSHLSFLPPLQSTSPC